MSRLPLILASASPRRRELLTQIGVPHQLHPVDICEAPQAGEEASAYTQRLALEKAQAAQNQLTCPAWILGSDTTVVVDGEILGKPENQAQHQHMLLKLSGRRHQVVTAVALVGPDTQALRCVITEVEFADLSLEQIAAYWQTGEPQDKAGGYAIQGLASVFVKAIHGSYSAVVGLPLFETAQLLSEYQIPMWHQAQS